MPGGRRWVHALVLAALAACDASQPTADDPGEAAAPPSGPATILLAGDTMLGRGIDAQLAADPALPLFREFEPWTADADLLAVNLETTITTAEERWPGKNFHFKMAPERAALAFGKLPVAAGTPIFVSLANNHALDFFEAGLRQTLQTLDGLGIARAGAGLDDAEARAPAIVTTASGVSIGLLSVSDHCSCGSDGWRAGPSSPGIWQIDTEPGADWDELRTAIVDVRAKVDWVIVSLHWGPNWVESWPLQRLRDLAAELAAAGASVIVGHSAHHVLPLENIDGVPVLYGTGDFVDDYSPVDGFRNDLSYAARVVLDPTTGAQVEVVPLRIQHGDAHFVHPLADDDPDAAYVREAAGLPPTGPAPARPASRSASGPPPPRTTLDRTCEETGCCG
jgi:poly-gamma-glutamate capsule biosynthesis protein CapA/YwtB (metallophosphatase superfamily)